MSSKIWGADLHSFNENVTAIDCVKKKDFISVKYFSESGKKSVHSTRATNHRQEAPLSGQSQSLIAAI